MWLPYLRILDGFFQQDEWFGYGEYIFHSGSGILELLSYFFAPTNIHYTPLTIFSIHSLFSVFGLNYTAFAYISIAMHLVNIILVYKLAQYFFKDNKLSFSVSILFGFFASTYQATTWVVANISTHGSTAFSLVAFIFLLKFSKNKIDKYLYLSLASLITSLLFKEISVGMILLLPFAFYLFAENSKNFSRVRLYYFVAGASYVFARVVMFLMPSSSIIGVNTVIQSQNLTNIIGNILVFPTKAVSQILIIDRILPTHQNFIVFILLSVFTYLIFTKNKEKGRQAIFFLCFAAINSFIYALSPSRSGVVYDIASRNLYLSSIGIAFWVVIILKFISNKHKKIAYVLISIIIIFNLFILNQKINKVVDPSIIRKEIISKMTEEYPDLPKKVIFYTESDKAFYGLPPNETTFPFQSGLGQTLLAVYQDKEKFSKNFYTNRFLWEMDDQDYMEIEGRGFGYFRDFDKLAAAIKNYDLSTNSVIAYRYSNSTESITDNTTEIRGRLVSFFIDKKIINSNQFIATSSHNDSDISLAFDNNLETAWDSQIPYKNPQYIQLDLRSEKEIVQISIDSYTNFDQNVVGYAVEVSSDEENWENVFYANRYAPWGSDTIVDLYLTPTKARYIKVKQIGDHAHASWVVHEMKLYEKI